MRITEVSPGTPDATLEDEVQKRTSEIERLRGERLAFQAELDARAHAKKMQGEVARFRKLSAPDQAALLQAIQMSQTVSAAPTMIVTGANG